MEGDKDREARPARESSAETTTWRGGAGPPRVAPPAMRTADSESVPISQQADTVVTESGAARAARNEMEMTSDGVAAPGSLAFERIEPSALRGERVRLDPRLARIRVGRSNANDLRVYSPSTSRKHAVIERNFAGQWVLSALAGKLVKVDGHRIEESIVLEAGMDLVFGGDHLRSVAVESSESNASPAEAVSAGFENRLKMLSSKGVLAVAFVVGVALGILLWLRS